MVEAIRQYKAKNDLKKVKILDVGGRNGRLGLFLDEGDEHTILDLREGDEPNLIVGDGTDMGMFADGEFDVVVSGDVYEHIVPEKRARFVQEAFRVSKDLVILAAPFDRPGVHEAEVMVNDYFKKQLGKDHEWLLEHIENGLPDEAELQQVISAAGYQHQILPSNDLDNWVLLQLLIFYSYSYGVSDDLINRFYRSYNRDLFHVEDFRLGSYRQVYVMSKEPLELKLPYDLNQRRRRMLWQKAFDTIASYTRDKSDSIRGKDQMIERHAQSVDQLHQMLEDSAQKRTNLEHDLQQKDQEQEQLQRAYDDQSSELQEFALQVHLKENHIQNQNQTIETKNAQIHQKEETIHQLHVQMKHKDDHLHDLEHQMKTQVYQIEAFESKMEKVKERLQQKNDFIREQHQQLKQAQWDLDVVKKKSIRRHRMIQLLEGEIVHRNQLLEEMLGDMESLQKEADRDIEILNTNIVQLEQRIERMAPEYAEFQQVKGSLTYRFLCFHRSVTGWFVGLWSRCKQLFRGAKKKVKDPLNEQYAFWMKQHELKDADRDRIRSEVEAFAYQPTVSIVVPVYNVAPKWLDKCFQSVMDQLYSKWELCVYDDASTDQKTLQTLRRWEGKDERIKIRFGSENRHISAASNAALELATGEFVGLLDNDDELTEDALYEVVKVLNEDRSLDMIYSDEDKLELDGRRVDPHFKPDWSPETFESMMYSCHFGVYRRSLVEEIGGFREGYEGSQDYDLVLRLTEKTDRIHHISKILYHWRKIPGSTAATTDAKGYAYQAAENALLDRLIRQNNAGRVHQSLWTGSYRVQRELDHHPLVSIIIPFRDQPDYLRRCLESLQKSTYQHYEVMLVSNQSQNPETFELVEHFRQNDHRIRFGKYDDPFNFSAINNWAAQKAKGEYLLFLNNDTEVISPDWIESMLEMAMRPGIGAVGAKLLYPNNTIQHAGVILGINGVANHAFRHMPADWHGYFGYANVVRNYSAVTAACLMISKQHFDQVGGFDEEHLAVAYNDVDLCLKLLKKGYRNVYTPFAQLYHHESISRGQDSSGDQRFDDEATYMKDRWGEWIENDPYYNPHLTRQKEDFALRVD